MNVLEMAGLIAPMSDLRAQQLAWLDNIISSSGLTLTDIARRAGLNPSTLSRFHANDDSGHTLTSRSVKKIEDATGVPAYEQRIRPSMAFFSEEEGEPYIFNEKTQDIMIHALRAVADRSKAVELWTLKTTALSAAGFDRGDVVVVDREEKVRPGDAVCALKFDHRRGISETVFRVYRTPYLLTALADGQPGLPDIVDNENVVIKGVVVGGCRMRG